MRITARTLIIIALVIGLASPLCLAENKNAGQEKEEDYVAIVNGEKIPMQLMEQKINMIKKQYASRGRQLGKEDLTSLKHDLADRMVKKELLYQESMEKDINIDPGKVDKQIQQFRDQFSSKDKYRQQLSSLGYTEDLLRTEISRNMAIQQLIDQEIASNISVTEQDAQNYYNNNPDKFKTPEKVKARHILVKTDKEGGSGGEAAMDRIKEIQDRISSGEKFAEVAKQESDCRSSESGGDLGFFSRGQMVEPFEKAAFSLEPGEVSDIVETRFGYHLIKVEEKKPASKKSYEEVKERIMGQLKQDKIKQELPGYLKELRKDAEIEMNMPEKAEGSSKGQAGKSKG